ncbi:hypothetical protein ACVT98_09420 [Vibrio campbellii]
MNKNIWKDEMPLLYLVVGAFFLLCFVEAQLPVFSPLQGTWVEAVLTSEGLKNIASGILISIIAAYAFYIFIDFLPRRRKHRDTMIVLDALICSILDSYNRSKIFGHQTTLPYVDTSLLTEPWLANHSDKLKRRESTYKALLCAMQTAHTRREAFNHSLILASQLSPKHSMQWLVILDKVRLLAENFGKNPEVSVNLVRFVDCESELNPVKSYKGTLNLRLLEFIEEVENWRALEQDG